MKRWHWLLLAALLALGAVLAGCRPAAQEEEAAPAEGAAQQEEVIVITAWAQGNNVERWRADGLVEAAKKVTDFKVEVKAELDSAGWADYKKRFTLAADAGEAPNIILSGHEDIPVWAQAGYIIEFEWCRAKYPEFDDVIDSLWNSVTWNGKIWGVPQDTEARPMFFNKTKLKELGWSDEEIESLPERIKNGEFTLDDLIATAKEAIEKGVVKPGYGYWHRPRKGSDFLQYYAAYGGRLYDPETDQLVVNRGALEKWYAFQRRVVEEGITPENFIGTEWSIWHQTVTSGEVLFWNGGIWQWADWAVNYVQDKGGEDYLFQWVGYALQPTGIPGRPGVTLSHPLVYMITSEQASGATKQQQEAACAVLAKVTTPEINTKHAVESTHLGILKSQANYPEYTNKRFLSETLYMLDYNFYLPNHPQFGPYFDILWDFMVKAENGELSPQEAAKQAIELLQAELGDAVKIED